MSFTSSCLLKPFDVNSELGLQIQEAIGPNIYNMKRGKVDYNKAIQRAVEALGFEAKPEEYAAFARAQSTPYTIFQGRDITYMVDPVTNKKWSITPIENSDNVEYEELTFFNDPLNAVKDFSTADGNAFIEGKTSLFNTAYKTRQESLNKAIEQAIFESLPKRIQSLKAVENRQARIGNIAHVMSTKISDAIDRLVASIDKDSIDVVNDKYDDEMFAKYNVKKMLNEPDNVNKTRLLEAIQNRQKEYSLSRAKAIQQIGIESIIKDAKQYFLNRITGDDEEMVSDEAVNKIKTMLNYFDILVPEALEVLKDIEGVTVNLAEGTIEDVENEATENLYETQLEDEYGMSEEEIARQTYGQFGTSSIRSGASTRLKRLLSTLEYFDPADGCTYIDDIEEPIYIDGNRAFAELLNICNDLVSAEELIPRLRKEALTRPWLNDVADMAQDSIASEDGPLEEYDNFFADLWYTMRKDQAVFSKIETSTEYGIQKNNVRNINQVEGTKAVNDAWNANINSLFSSVKKTQNFPKDLFDSELNMNEDVYNNVIEFLKNNKSKEDIVAHIDDFKAIMSMIGIPIAHDSLVNDCLKGLSKKEASELAIHITAVFKNLKSKGLKQILDKDTVFSDFNQKYIKNILNSIVPLNVESSIRYAGKSYYGHIYPNFINKFAKIADSENTRRTIKFLYNEYGRYPQYATIVSPISQEDLEKMPGAELSKKLKFNNVILQEIWDKACKGEASDIRLKYVVGRGETEYYKMSAIDIAITGIAEYYADDSRFCQMICPLESDKPSMNTMRWEKSKYRMQGIIHDRVKGDRLQNRSLTQIANSLIQEAKRIRMVKERANAYINYVNKGEKPPFELIENLDAVSKDGKSINKNAAGFRFCLNATYNGLTIEEDGKNIPLEDWIVDHLDDNELQLRKDLADKVIIPQLQKDYEKCFEDWKAIGLFKTRQKKISKDQEKPVFVNFAGFEAFSDVESLPELKNKLFLYFLDYTAFTTAVTNILTSDLAFYKNNNYVDAQKRAGEWHAPGQRVNTAILSKIKTVQIDRSKTKRVSNSQPGKIVFQSVDRYPKDKYGHIQQREIILKDIKVLAPSAGNMIAALTEKFTGDPEAVEKIKSIIDGHKGINTADAQAYRSVDSYLDFLKAKGDPNYKACALAIKRIEDGHSTRADLDLVMQTFKPFNYGLREVKDPVTGTIFPAPIQCKNSEFPILVAIFSKTCRNSADSLPMRVLDQFMRDNNIHVLQFESAIKASNQGQVNVKNFRSTKEKIVTTAEDTRRNQLYAELENQVYDENGNERPDIIKYLNIDDWGIQGEQPEHIINHTQLRGSQIQKLITVNHPANAIFNVNGEQLSEQEWQDTYNKVLSAQYKSALDKLSEIFGSKQKFSNELKRMIGNSTRYSNNMKSAVEINPETNDFNVDFDDPAISSDIQMLLLSFMNKKLNRMESKGGSCIQVSDFGYSEQLHLVFEDANGNEIMLNPNDMPADMNSYLAQHPGIRIKYMECYLPVYDKRLYNKLITYHYNKNGDIVNTTLELYDSEGNPRIPEDLLKAIGYRVPTESYYSMMALRIKGFLPQQNGSSIMLPAEIVSLSGTDFDIDHMYLMLPNFDVKDLRYKKAAEYLQKSVDYITDDIVRRNTEEDEVYNAIQNLKHKEQFNIVDGQKSGTPTAMTESDEEVIERVMKKWKRDENPLLLNSNEAKIVEWFTQTQEDANGNSVNGDTEVLEYKKYQYKDANGNLTDPNNFDKETQDNAILELMYGVLTNHDMIDQFLKPGGFDETKKTSRIAFLLTKGAEVVNPMIEEKIKNDEDFANVKIYPNLYDTLNALTLDNIESLESSMQELVNPTSPSTYMKFHQQNMVGKQMLAIFSVALSSHALWQHNNAKIITSIHPLFGFIPTEIDGRYDRNGKFIAHNLVVGVVASADNVKDPTLTRMGLNKLTINAAINMLRMGYTYDDVAIMLNQPIMRYLSNEFFANGATGTFSSSLRFLKKRIEDEELEDDPTIGTLDYDTLIDGMNQEFDIEHITPTQMDVLNWFFIYEKEFSKDMRKYTDESKPEKSFKTTIGATTDTFNEAYVDLAHTRNDSIEVEGSASMEYESKISSNVSDGTDVVATRQAVTADSIRLLKNTGAFPVTFHVVTRNIRAILKDSYNLSGEDLESAMRDWSSFLRQCSSLYITDSFPVKLGDKEYSPKPETEELLEVAYEKTKQYYQKEFPDVFEKFKNRYPFGTFKILDILSVNKRGKFKVINATSRRAKGYLETEISNSWLRMAICGDPVVENFAKQLYMYCAFRGQFSSFNKGFANYGSALIGMTTGLEKQNLSSLLDSTEGGKLASRFLFQYFNNHQELLSKKAASIYAFKKNEEVNELGSGLYAQSSKKTPVVIKLDEKSIEETTTSKNRKEYLKYIADNKNLKYISLIGTNKVENPLTGKTEKKPYKHIYMRQGDSTNFALLPKAGSDVLSEYNPYLDGYVGCLSEGIYSNEVLKKLFETLNFASPFSKFRVKDQGNIVDVE